MSYASLGATHHACEDIAFLRALPGMSVICPGDAMEVRAALRAALKHDGPVYIRLGKKNEPVIHPDVPDLKIGEAIILREGADVCLLSTGNLLPNVCEAADLLAEAGISAQVVSFHTVKPLDERLLRDAFARFPLVTTVEEHSVIGGLGGAVAEWRADQDVTGARLLRIGTPDNFMHEAGSQSHARELFGLTPDAIVQKIRAAVAETMKA
jgi:transketolase